MTSRKRCGSESEYDSKVSKYQLLEEPYYGPNGFEKRSIMWRPLVLQHSTPDTASTMAWMDGYEKDCPDVMRAMHLFDYGWCNTYTFMETTIEVWGPLLNDSDRLFDGAFYTTRKDVYGLSEKIVHRLAFTKDELIQHRVIQSNDIMCHSLDAAMRDIEANPGTRRIVCDSLFTNEEAMFLIPPNIFCSQSADYVGRFLLFPAKRESLDCKRWHNMGCLTLKVKFNRNEIKSVFFQCSKWDKNYDFEEIPPNIAMILERPAPDDIQLKHTWDSTNLPYGVFISQVNPLMAFTFMDSPSALIRCKTGFSSGIHVWEIEWETTGRKDWGSGIGVTTATANLAHRLGSTPESWGVLFGGEHMALYHNDLSQGRYPKRHYRDIFPDKFLGW